MELEIPVVFGPELIAGSTCLKARMALKLEMSRGSAGEAIG